MYFTPWLWYDGNQHGDMDYTQWESKIVSRMNQPAPLTINLDGEYSPSSNSGTLYATFKNDSNTTISGRVIIVITEDSLYYPAPNGVIWHSNVPRDYIPDNNGTGVSIPSGDSITITMSFTTHPNWNKAHCKIKTWIQSDVMQPDSTKEIWQGALVNLLELGINEQKEPKIEKLIVQTIPNPCLRKKEVFFNLPFTVKCEIFIYDCAGREVNKVSGNTNSIRWNLKDCQNKYLNPGVYIYRVVSSDLVTTGKLIIE
ncbi:MAG: Omp28-related outer membrane protein [bacterium]